VLTQLYMFKKEYEKCLDVFEYGLKRKAVYPIFPSGSYWQPLANNERFKKIVEENNRLRAEFTAKTTPTFEILTPAALASEIKYPLFIVLHGWNECLTDINKYWQTEMIKTGIILVFIQSSQVVSSQKFGWDDTALARKDIKEILEKIVDKYPVDTAKMIIGGFSQGGMTALDIAAANVIPTKGFFALSPGGPLPADFNVENLTKARQRGLRGTIIIRELDKTIKEKIELEKILQQAEFPCRYIVSQDQRWYPADFAKQLDAALVDILEKGTAPAADEK
ncbi:MAG: hypothetical protein L0Y73_04295, partial [Candidatus Aminicenantes bacterium]|nr:hypothetical protein [Candidatus Aminicenantes bacterium]